MLTCWKWHSLLWDIIEQYNVLYKTKTHTGKGVHTLNYRVILHSNSLNQAVNAFGLYQTLCLFVLREGSDIPDNVSSQIFKTTIKIILLQTMNFTHPLKTTDTSICCFISS